VTQRSAHNSFLSRRTGAVGARVLLAGCVSSCVVIGCGQSEPMTVPATERTSVLVAPTSTSKPMPVSLRAVLDDHQHPHAFPNASGASRERWHFVSPPSQHPGTGDPSVCTCSAAMLVDGWCERHAAGRVAGLSVPSAQLFETLDPHGHVIAHESVTCPTCVAAIRSDGYCNPCHIGWRDGLAYMTRLTWLLAGGTRTSAADGLPEFPAVGGVVGNVRIADDATLTEALQAFEVLRSAVEMCDRCEVCACAMVYDGTCPDCNITYFAGRPSDRPTK